MLRLLHAAPCSVGAPKGQSFAGSMLRLYLGNRPRRAAGTALLIPTRHIPSAVVNLQRQKVLRTRDLHFDLAPFVVLDGAAWAIAKDVLVAQFAAGARGRIGNARRIVEGDRPSAGGLGDLGGPLPPKSFV